MNRFLQGSWCSGPSLSTKYQEVAGHLLRGIVDVPVFVRRPGRGCVDHVGVPLVHKVRENSFS